MSLVHLADRRTAGTPDPAEVVDATVASHTGRYGRRTLAHILWTITRLAELHPGARLVIIQGCYHTGYEPSAGTHDGDGVLDVEIIGLTWTDAQAFLRDCGWAAWWRHTGSWAAQDDWHVHMVSVGCPGPVGAYVPRQVTDFLGTPPRDGLDGHAVDPTPHPKPQLVFDYPAYLEDNVDDATIDKIADRVVAKLLAVDVEQGQDETTVAQALNRAQQTRADLRLLAKSLGHPLP